MKKPIFLVCLVLITVFVACSPKDLTMEQFFKKNKPIFTKLAQMKLEDSQFNWVHNSSTPRDKSLSEERWDEYIKLMNKINVRSLCSKDNSVIFCKYDQKGYVYSEKELAPVYKSLDKEQSKAKPYTPIYKKIDDKWYLFYMKD